MIDVQNKGLQYFVVIAEQKKKDKFLSLLNNYDARGIEIVYGHGSMSPSAIAAAFGLFFVFNKKMIREGFSAAGISSAGYISEWALLAVGLLLL